MKVHLQMHLELDAPKERLAALLDQVENRASDAFRHVEGITLAQMLVAPYEDDDAKDPVE